MWSYFGPLTLAALSGLAMALQGSLNAALAKITGLIPATLIVHFSATLLTGLLLLLPLGGGGLAKALHAPWYLYLGGAIGVLITYGVAASIPKAGVAPATTAIIVGQVTTALLLDHFGCFGLGRIPFTWWKLLGVFLLACGACLLLSRS